MEPERTHGLLAVREGFEPSMPFDIHAFQACSFDRSDISPNLALLLPCVAAHQLFRRHWGSAPVNIDLKPAAPEKMHGQAQLLRFANAHDVMEYLLRALFMPGRMLPVAVQV